MKTAIMSGLLAALVSSAALPQSFVTLDDYPPEALAHHWEGTTKIIVTVNTDGRASDCRVTASSGHEVLDKAACPMFKRRARFSPATDETGKVVPSQFSTEIDWKIPS